MMSKAKDLLNLIEGLKKSVRDYKKSIEDHFDSELKMSKGKNSKQLIEGKKALLDYIDGMKSSNSEDGYEKVMRDFRKKWTKFMWDTVNREFAAEIFDDFAEVRGLDDLAGELWP